MQIVSDLNILNIVLNDFSAQVCKEAFKLNYRSVDCAEFYFNEKEIGEQGIKPFLLTHKREELFISSKVWSNHVTNVKEACLNSINNFS